MRLNPPPALIPPPAMTPPPAYSPPPADGDIIMEGIVWTITTVESDARLKKNITVS
jgi:hypothetical protein